MLSEQSFRGCGPATCTSTVRKTVVFWRASLARLATEDRGQDLLEYGLLVAAIVTAAVALFPPILAAMGTVFGAWGPAVNSVWEPPAPE